MKFEFEKEFRTDHPETIGETDKEFDQYNYTLWLEQQLRNCNLQNVSNNEVAVCPNCGDTRTEVISPIQRRCINCCDYFRQTDC